VQEEICSLAQGVGGPVRHVEGEEEQREEDQEEAVDARVADAIGANLSGRGLHR